MPTLLMARPKLGGVSARVVAVVCCLLGCKSGDRSEPLNAGVNNTVLCW